jgi:hypothetical protein
MKMIEPHELIEKLQAEVAELEAKLDVFDEMDEMLRICLKANVNMAEQLDRVRGLKPFVLADDQTFAVYYDELESALGDEDE